MGRRAANRGRRTAALSLSAAAFVNAARREFPSFALCDAPAFSTLLNITYMYYILV